MAHRCDERCVCPIHKTPLYFARISGEHACQDPDCLHAHGIVMHPERAELHRRYPWLDRAVPVPPHPDLPPTRLQRLIARFPFPATRETE